MSLDLVVYYYGNAMEYTGAAFPYSSLLTQSTREVFDVQEQFMTHTAKFADILLPVSTFLERNDVTIGEGVPSIWCVEPGCRRALLWL